MQDKSMGKRALGIFTPFIVYYVACVIVGNIFRDAMYEHPTEISSLAALLTIPVFVLMARKDRKKEDEAGVVQNKKAPLAKYGLVVGVSIAASVALNNILLFMNLAAYSETYQEAATTLYSPTFAVQLVCLGIIFPMMEEYLFRGLIYRRIRPVMSVKWAIFLSAFFFGMYHGNLVQMIYGTIAGVLLAYLYEKYGSMRAPILAHMLMNITSCVLTALDAFSWMLASSLRMGIITAICAAVAVAMLIWIREIDEKAEEM